MTAVWWAQAHRIEEIPGSIGQGAWVTPRRSNP